MAQARESGISPQHADLSKTVTKEITNSGLRNTELHYAFELVKVLGRLNKKTFNLEAPPISGLAPDSVVAYLRESTRLWMYGFHGASVALSRACFEETLKAGITIQHDPRVAQLDTLIDLAEREGRLDDCMAAGAHVVRRIANRFLHGQSITEADSRETLDTTRGIVEYVFSR